MRSMSEITSEVSDLLDTELDSRATDIKVLFSVYQYLQLHIINAAGSICACTYTVIYYIMITSFGLSALGKTIHKMTVFVFQYVSPASCAGSRPGILLLSLGPERSSSPPGEENPKYIIWYLQSSHTLQDSFMR